MANPCRATEAIWPESTSVYWPTVTVDDNHLPVKVPGVEVNEVADGLVVFDPGAQQVHYLNSTASVVYELCDGRSTTAIIVSGALELFPDASSPEIFVECLDDLAQRGLIR